MRIGETGIDVDFCGTSPKVNVGINVPLTYTQAMASFGVRCVVGNHVPTNAGSLAAVRVTAPEGTILNALRPLVIVTGSWFNSRCDARAPSHALTFFRSCRHPTRSRDPDRHRPAAGRTSRARG